MTALIDTNILVYRYDQRFAVKQRKATALLRRGVRDDDIRIAHQAIVEFVAAVTRNHPQTPPLLELPQARLEAEEFLSVFNILYPNADIVRLACRGSAAYQLAWFDAHMWAYAEYYGCNELWSEDFQHDRLYGSVRAINPFV